MKATILALVLTVAPHAFAANTEPVISLLIAGGMPTPDGAFSRTITVERTGRVVIDDRRGRDPAKEYVLTQMEPADMLAIGEAVGSLRGGRIAKPGDDGCADAPGYEYRVQKGATSLIVAEQINCQDLELLDAQQRPAARIIKSYLDDLHKLVH